MKDKQKRFENILQIQSVSENMGKMANYVKANLKAMGLDPDVDACGNIIVKKTSNNFNGFIPCFCAHLDTVHEIVKDYRVLQFREKNSWVYTSDTGVGGDDKCGIFVLLELLRVVDNIQCVFFVNEETGCLGSGAIDLKYFDNASCLIGIDRKNAGDCIVNHNGITVSNEFQKFIEPVIKKHGYHFEYGLITDVFTLRDRGLNLSAINLSCGYYNPHTSDEYVVYNELINCFNLCMSIAAGLKSHKYATKETQETTTDYYDSWLDDVCIFCGRGTDKKSYNSRYGIVCDRCLDDLIEHEFYR